MHRLYLRSEQLVEETEKLNPRWGGLSLPGYLEVFDEAGVLRPVFRIRLPEDYAHYMAELSRHLSLPGLTEARRTELAAHHDARFYAGLVEDPMFIDPVQAVQESLSRLVVRSDENETVDWQAWKVKVGESEAGVEIREPMVFSYYGNWQIYRFWALLESYTFRALLDPRRLHPAQVFTPDWDRSLKGAALSWTTGTPRPLRVVELLEEGGWLRALRQVSASISRAKWRAYEPKEAKWPEGLSLTFQQRWTEVLRDLRERCAQLAAALGISREGFRERVRLLLELWDETAYRAAPRLRKALQDDLWTAADWAYYLYDVKLPVLDQEVGYVDTRSGTTILDALRPVQTRARKTASKTLQRSIEGFNASMKPVVIDEAAVEQFIDFLDRVGVWAWYLHLEEVAHEIREPTDARIDRVFAGLRSMAIVTEQVLIEIARELRTDGAAGVAERDLREACRILVKKGSGWRAQVWKYVSQGWKKTTAKDLNLEQRLSSLADPRWLHGSSTEVQSVARTILTYVALRHFGSHRHSPAEVEDFQRLSTLFRAATYTTLFCWKLAKDDADRAGP